MQENEELKDIKTAGEAGEAIEVPEAACGQDRKSAKKCKKKNEEAERLKAELENTQEELEDVTRKWYSVTAEYENYRRRTQNQAAQRYQDGRNDVVASVFPIGDNLERALASCGEGSVKQGLEMILKAFKKVLDGEGIEEIDPTGQPFDAAVAEAIMAMPAEDGEESGIVKQTFAKGYKKGDKILRYAQVVVTQ